MAGRANLDVDIGLRGARRELVAAGAADVRLNVFRMDLSLHRDTQSSGAWRSPGTAGSRLSVTAGA